MDSTASVILALENAMAKNALEEIIVSLEGFRLESAPSPEEGCDLLIMEIGTNLNEELDQIRRIQESGTVKAICLTSTRSDPNLLLEALRSGAKEFIPQPIKADDVRRSLMSLKEKLLEGRHATSKHKRGKVINVIGSNGGVGTTTVAVNLARSLAAAKGAGSVALIDMNPIFGEVPLFLNLKPNFNWGKVVEDISRLDSTYLMSILTKHPSGVYVLPSPTGLDAIGAANPSVMEQLLKVMCEEFDYVIMDSGQSVDHVFLQTLQLSETVLVVAVPSLPCLINVRRLLDAFKTLGYPHEKSVQVIMNRYHKKSVISLKEAGEGIGKEVAWAFPNDYVRTMAAINEGKPLFDVARGETITKSYRDFAEELLRKDTPKHGKETVLGLKFAKKFT